MAVRRRPGRAVVFCVIPSDLGARLHEPLRRHFRDDPTVEVIVERRGAERRALRARRAPAGAPATAADISADRRRVRGPEGRRVADRRAPAISIDAPDLPRPARRHADRLVFLERIEPATQHAEDLDSARLVARFQAGDEDAFGEIYMRYFDRIYNYLRVVVRDTHDAEDLAQQAFLRIFAALPRYERRGEPFRSWAFVIVRNLAVSHLRRESRLDVLDPAELNNRREAGPAEEDGSLRALDWVSDRDLLIFIERLPLAQRQVLVLRYMLDLPHQEVADILGRSLTDVRMLQHRAQRFLRDRLVAVGRRTERSGKRPQLALGRAGHAFSVRRRRFALMR